MTRASIRPGSRKNRGRFWRSAWCALGVVTGLLVAPLFLVAQQLPPGNPAVGRQLFTGERQFRNGGPACASCHSIAGIPFPNGGVLGPDLTQEYTKLGPEGMAATLETLFFPTMLPLFENHLLTRQEQADLGAFIQSVNSRPPPPNYTLELGLLALAGMVVLLVGMAIIWHGRLTGVREPLVKAVTGEVHELDQRHR